MTTVAVFFGAAFALFAQGPSAADSVELAPKEPGCAGMNQHVAKITAPTQVVIWGQDYLFLATSPAAVTVSLLLAGKARGGPQTGSAGRQVEREAHDHQQAVRRGRAGYWIYASPGVYPTVPALLMVWPDGQNAIRELAGLPLATVTENSVQCSTWPLTIPARLLLSTPPARHSAPLPAPRNLLCYALKRYDRARAFGGTGHRSRN